MRRRGSGSISKTSKGFRAQISRAGSRFSLGTFSSEKLAEAAIEVARMKGLSTRELVLNRTPQQSGRVIYFIRQGFPSGPIKIGSTKDVRKRLLTMQTMNADILTLLAMKAGTKREELALHRRFETSRIHGEWFRQTPELIALIRELSAHSSALDHLEEARKDPS